MAVLSPVAAAVSAMALVWQTELNKAGKTRMELKAPPGCRLDVRRRSGIAGG